jgi:YD repeat-containing protein
LFASLTFGQITNVTDDQSTPVPGAGHDYIHLLSETVNPANGSLSIRIGVPTPKGLGISLPFSFNYDSNGTNHLTPPLSFPDVMFTTPSDGVPIPPVPWTSDASLLSSGGWSYGIPYLTWTPDPYPGTVTTTGSYTCTFSTNFMFQDPGGGRHALGLSTLAYQNSACQPTTNSYGSDDYYLASVLSSGDVVAADADGTTYDFSPTYIDPANYTSYNPAWMLVALPTITDRNDHTITASALSPMPGESAAFSFTETATGRKLVQASGFGNTGDTVSVPGLGGQPLTYTLTWGFITSNAQVEADMLTNPMGMCTGIQADQQGYAAIRAITLPNGQQYQFQYDSDNPSLYDQQSTGTFHGPYGLVSKITYPTGGYVQYVWGENTFSNYIQGSWYYNNGQGWVMQGTGCSYLYGTPAVTDHYVSYDGQTIALHQHFTYNTNWNNETNEAWTTKTTTAVSHDQAGGTSTETDYTYTPVYVPPQPIPPGAAQPYPGYVPVESTVTTLNAVGGSPLRTVTKYWYDPYLLQGEQVVDNGVVTSDQFFDYVGMGQLADKYECGAGQTCACPPGQTCQNATFNHPSPPTAFTRLTNYHYATIPNRNYGYPTGTTGQGIFRPDTITVTGVISPSNSGTAAQTVYTYDGNGNATNKTEKCEYNCANDLPTGYGYDGNGQLTSMTVPRGNTTYYNYMCSDTYLSQINYPTTSSNGQTHSVSFQFDCSSGLPTQSTDQNGNPTNYGYNDLLNRLTSVTFPAGGGQTTNIYTDYMGSGTVTSSIETDKVIDASHTLKTYQILDGLGLVTQTQTLDQQGNGNICVDTAYDGFERVLTVSNPQYNCTTPGSYLTTYAYDPVGRTVSVLYPDGNAATTSYNGLTATVKDAGGRTRAHVADELGHLAGVTEDPLGLDYVTSYPYYSALDDLLTVSQGSQTRSFSYDSSRGSRRPPTLRAAPSITPTTATAT